MTEYEPSRELTGVLARFDAAQAALNEARDALRARVADELRNYDVTTTVIAQHLPWSDETVRGIAREFEIPHRRKPTVRSIKPKRKT